MDSLRRTHMLARAVLVWFFLCVGVSVATPVVGSRPLTTVCSGSGGLVLVEQGDTHGSGPAAHLLDCPLCIAQAPPPSAASPYQPPAPGHVLRKWLTRRSPVLLADGPDPARGPPASS
ncbi:MAG: DUF2946 family protein [Ramlibacter sp.]